MRLPLLVLVAAAAVTSTAFAQDYPKLRSGQWELTTSSTKSGAQAPPAKSAMCTDEAIQKEMTTMGAGMSKGMCSRNDIRREGSRFIVSAECKIGESKIISKSVMTLTGDTAYKTEIKATYNPPFMGMKESTTTLEGKYVGPCRDGLVPGDFVAPNGHKFNLKNIGAMKNALPPTQSRRPAKKAAQ
ncbi:MAG: DUF3617 family protein [Burkholderiales bacterium]|nr:DUF3617 family protein [Burkholderiales bacterium]